VEQGVVDSSRGYLARGHVSHVISNGGSRVGELEGATHHTLPVHQKNLFTAWSQVARVAQIITENRIDVVHARSRVPAWIGYFAARRAGVPLVTTVHGFYSVNGYSRIMAKGARVIAVSTAVADYAVRSLRADPERVRLVHRGLDPERFDLGLNKGDKHALRAEFGLPEFGPVVAIIGRITRLKGHPDYLRAMAEVLKTIPDAVPLIVGAVPPKKAAYGAELSALAASLGLADKAVFLGSSPRIGEILQVCDVLVSASSQPESFGRTLMEAMAAGVPVVASAHGGALDLVLPGATGALFPPGDSADLTEKLLEILTRPDGGRSLGQAGRARVQERFTMDDMVDRTLAVYRELCGADESPRP